jgi:prenyltransferase beta subunit
MIYLNYEIISFFSCQTYEGGFGACPGAEAHGGYSFCGYATLLLLDRESICDRETLLVCEKESVFENLRISF